MLHVLDARGWLVVAGCFLFTSTANAQVVVSNDIYTSNNDMIIKHYSSAGAFINSFSFPSIYGNEVRGMAVGPDGLLYTTISKGSAGFSVVACNAAGIVQQTYSGPDYLAGSLASGKINFANNGQFFVAGVGLRRFSVGNPIGMTVYSSVLDVYDMQRLGNGNLLLLNQSQIQEITTSGSVVRTINSSIGLNDARGIEYNPVTNKIYVSMLGYSGQSFRVMRLDGQTGLVEKNVQYHYADDLYLTPDNRLLVGSSSLNVGIFDLDLNQVGSLAGGSQEFVTQIIPAPEPGSFVLLGTVALMAVARQRRVPCCLPLRQRHERETRRCQ
jgi:hypothetical protein